MNQTTTTTALPTFTDRAFVRSTGRSPRGTGHWAFQASTRESAFDSDLVGEIEFFVGTLSNARSEARRHFAGAAFVAVLP